MFYEGLKDLTEYGKKKIMPNSTYQINSTMEGLLLGGLAGGMLLDYALLSIIHLELKIVSGYFKKNSHIYRTF